MYFQIVFTFSTASSTVCHLFYKGSRVWFLCGPACPTADFPLFHRFYKGLRLMLLFKMRCYLFSNVFVDFAEKTAWPGQAVRISLDVGEAVGAQPPHLALCAGPGLTATCYFYSTATCSFPDISKKKHFDDEPYWENSYFLVRSRQF